MLQQIKYVKLGIQRGKTRVWLEGRRLEAAGFTPGASYRMLIDIASQRIELLREDGARVVSRKTVRDRVCPVIDICSGEVERIFGAAAERVKVEIHVGRVVVMIHPTDRASADRKARLMEKLQSGAALDVGSVAHGGGILDNALHAGLERAGIKSRLAWAIEVEAAYLEVSMANNSVFDAQTLPILGPMEDVELDRLARVDIVSSGIPCVGASLAGRAKNKLKAAEHHESAGVLFYALLNIIKAVNPSIVIIENVVQYSSTLSMHVIRELLAQWSYDVHETVLDGNAMGALEDRKRMCMVAVPTGFAFRIEDLLPIRTKESTLGDALEDIPAESDMYQPRPYLVEKEQRDIAAGKGFRRQLLTGSATACGCVGAGYGKIRSTEPMLLHPNDPLKSRLLTPVEHARVKTIPPELIRGVSNTTAHEILGQSVIWTAFVALGSLIGTTLSRWFHADANTHVVPDEVAPWTGEAEQSLLF